MTQQYDRFVTVPLEEVLAIVRKHNGTGKKKIREVVAGKEVKVNGVRLHTFATKGYVCSTCGLQATHFAIERPKFGAPNAWHLNMWGVKDGEEVLFTHDHTLARGDGGADHLDNTTTMCSPCNAAKAVLEIAARKQE